MMAVLSHIGTQLNGQAQVTASFFFAGVQFHPIKKKISISHPAKNAETNAVPRSLRQQERSQCLRYNGPSTLECQVNPC